jgi:exopolyphosphatase / guanosine-5'-triphosphate,3'-diphosphate pyrophosphatase
VLVPTARNAEAFIAAATHTLGHDIEVISGIEEARLIYLGVAASMPDDGRPRLVVDIGGGSTELIAGVGAVAQDKESLYVGCVAQSLAWFPDGRVTSRRLAQATLAAAIELEPVVARFRPAPGTRVLGASGTVRAVRDAIATLQPGTTAITPAGLARLQRAVVAARNGAGLAALGVREDRRAVFAGGLSVVLALFGQLGLTCMEPAEGALREGLLHDLVGRIEHEDVRPQTIAALARRYHVDEAHAQRVAQMALALLGKVARAWQLGAPEHAHLLEWAARVHEIGLDVAHAEHHKHGAYVLAHGDLPGFSRQEQRALAALVRAHRRKFQPAVFDAVPLAQRTAVTRLAVLLRLAVVLHRGRTPVAPPVPVIGVTGNRVRVRLPARWLRAHPLTRADLAAEAAYLAPAGVRLEVG